VTQASQIGLALREGGHPLPPSSPSVGTGAEGATSAAPTLHPKTVTAHGFP